MDTTDTSFVVEYHGPTLGEQVIATAIITVVATAAPFLVIGAIAGTAKVVSYFKNKNEARKLKKAQKAQN